MSNELNMLGEMSMGAVWEILVDTILAKTSCLVKISNLTMKDKNLPKETATCQLSVLSYWSPSDGCQSFYSKLEREDTPD